MRGGDLWKICIRMLSSRRVCSYILLPSPLFNITFHKQPIPLTFLHSSKLPSSYKVVDILLGASQFFCCLGGIYNMVAYHALKFATGKWNLFPCFMKRFSWDAQAFAFSPADSVASCFYFD